MSGAVAKGTASAKGDLSPVAEPGPATGTAPAAVSPSQGKRATRGDSLAAAIWVKSAVHAGGLVGGIGLKAADLKALQGALAQPDGLERVLAAATSRTLGALEEAGISYGILEDEVDAAARSLVEAARSGSDDAFARKVAQGEAPEPGQDGYLEYLQNHRGLSFADLSGLPLNSKEKKRTVVQAFDVLAVVHPPTQPKDGTSVKGEKLQALAAPEARPLVEIAGPHTVVDKDKVLAECDGMCEEDVEGWLRVVPEIVVEKVDRTTGHVPETGISEANVAVIASVAAEGIATTEAVFVGAGKERGSLEGRASVRALHLLVHGAIVGEGDGDEARIEVDEFCCAREVRNRTIGAAHILVAEDCHFASLEAEQSIRVDGTLRGGTAVCGGDTVVRGDLGTEGGGSNTRVAAPSGPMGGRKTRRATVLVARYRAEAESLEKKLEDLERRSQKRAKADPYWAKLIEGERPRPSGPLQTKTLMQFAELYEQRKALDRQIAGHKRAVQKLSEAGADEGGEDAAKGISLVVGGTLYMDVTFEADRAIGDDDQELALSFALEGERLSGRTLADVKALLTKQVNAYREQQSAHLEERRKALEELHKGQANKPDAPKMEDRSFSVAVTWDEAVEGEERFVLATEVCVRALEPSQFTVRNAARLKEPAGNVTVTVSGDGARTTFGLSANTDGVTGWQEDGDVLDALEGIVIRGASGTDALGGRARIEIG